MVSPHPSSFTDNLRLQGTHIRLESLKPEHVDALYAIGSAHAEEFIYTSTPTTDAQCEAYFDKAFTDMEAHRAYVFTVFSQEDDNIIGTSRYTDIRWNYRNCELGYTWFAPKYHGTGINVEAKLLMLSYLFEEQDWLRVQIHTDTRNFRSRHAIQALGARYEGILRAHGIMKDGHIRDTIVFSVIHSDWNDVKATIQARLEAKRAAYAERNTSENLA